MGEIFVLSHSKRKYASTDANDCERLIENCLLKDKGIHYLTLIHSF